MFRLGQEVMVIGDARCPVGTVSVVVEISPCDMGDRGIQNLYRLESRPLLDGMEVYFQAQHLMAIDRPLELLEQIDLELRLLPEPVQM